MHSPRSSAVLEDAVEGCAEEECDCDREGFTHLLVRHRKALSHLPESRENRR